MHEIVCSDCDGKRLKKEVLAVKVGGINIHEFTEMSAVDALGFIEKLIPVHRQGHQNLHHLYRQVPCEWP